MSVAVTESELKLQLRLWQQQPSKGVLQACTPSETSQHYNPQTLVLSGLADTICQVLPPNRQYVQRLVKQLIQLVEGAGDELLEELLRLYTALLLPVDGDMVQIAQENTAWSYKTFYYSSCHSMRQLQQLEQWHVANCFKACGLLQLQQQQHHTEQQLGDVHSDCASVIPPVQLQQLQAQQQLMGDLLAAAGVEADHLLGFRGTTLGFRPRGAGFIQMYSGSAQQSTCDAEQPQGNGTISSSGCRWCKDTSLQKVQQHSAAQQQQVTAQEQNAVQQQLPVWQQQQQQLQAGKQHLGQHQHYEAVQQQLQQFILDQRTVPQQQHHKLEQNMEQTQQQQRVSNHHHQHQHQQQQQLERQAVRQAVQHSAGLLSIHMSGNLFEGGTGCHMWDAGFLMAEFVLNHQHLFTGKTCLEIGCGPGLVGSCLARLQPRLLLLTDGDPQTLLNCSSNIALNGHDVQLLGGWQAAVQLLQQEQRLEPGAKEQQLVLACPLDWHSDVPGLWADVIVGSDILYDPTAVPSVVRLLSQLLGAQGALACGSSSTVEDGRPGDTDGFPTTADRLLPVAEELATAGAFKDTSSDSDSSSNVASGRDPDSLTAAATAFVHEKRRASVAYLSTTKRQPSTLKIFEDLAKDNGMHVQELDMQPKKWREEPVSFGELPALHDRESKFLLHRVTAI